MADLSRPIGMRLSMRNVAPGRGKGRVVSEISLPQLTPLQIARLERLLRAGFKFVTFEHLERYLAVEKKGFVALLDVSGEKVSEVWERRIPRGWRDWRAGRAREWESLRLEK